MAYEAMGNAAYLIRAKTDTKHWYGQDTMYWVVLSETLEEAVAAVRRRVTEGWRVEPTDSTLGPETIEALGLVPGQARKLA